MSKYDRKYRRIAKSISPSEITASYSQMDLSWDDLFTDGQPTRESNLFLGKYSLEGIKFIIERFGLDRQARHHGIRNIDVVLDTHDPFLHGLKIYNGKERTPENLVLDFTARYQLLTPSDEGLDFLYKKPLNVLMIEWLLLQNPGAQFTHRKPQLPGQEYPGLGMGDQLLALFTLMGRHLRVDGILNVPEHYHTALMFSRRFSFLDPRKQAQLMAVARDLWKKYRLAVIAWACFHEAIRHVETDEIFRWKPRKQMIAINPLLKKFFNSPAYRKQVEKEMETQHFELDEDRLRHALSFYETPPITF